MQNNPVLVDVYRSDQIESRHRGAAVAVDSSGQVIFTLGEVEQMVFPRSSFKPLQAIPLLETGAADHYGLSPAEISLACASHNAEAFHTETVTRWLDRLDLGADDLENGPSLPLHEDSAHQLLRDGGSATRVHHNCSGKHTGMLTLSRHLGENTKGYSLYDHPTQRCWMQTMSELVDQDVFSLPWDRDGCGLPAVCMPLKSLATGFARFDPALKQTPSRADAMARIISAIAAHPEMIAGSGRCCSDVIRVTAGEVIVKTGAEAVYAGTIPERGIGFALKIDDGSVRGSQVALGALLNALGVVDAAQCRQLAHHFNPDVTNSQEWVTGSVRPAEIWSA